MIKQFVAWCGKISPTTEGEQLMIQYGAELLAENAARMSLLLLISFSLGKGWECIVFLLIFGCLADPCRGASWQRPAGAAVCGWHRCWQFLFWAEKRRRYQSWRWAGYLQQSLPAWHGGRQLQWIETAIPAEGILKKKIDAVLTILVYYFILLFLEQVRNVAVCAVVLEAMTLLPEIHNKN